MRHTVVNIQRHMRELSYGISYLCLYYTYNHLSLHIVVHVCAIITFGVWVCSRCVVGLTFHSSPFRRTSTRLSLQG